jgi:hypothetical protein
MAQLKVRITEQEWLAAEDITSLDLWRSAPNHFRKWQLFGCACARRVLPFLPDALWAEALTSAEQFADGQLAWETMKQIRKRFFPPWHAIRNTDPHSSENAACQTVHRTTMKEPRMTLVAAEPARYAYAETTRPDWQGGHDAEERQQMVLARDIFKNPFLSVAVSPTWQTGPVATLAQAAYDERALPAGHLDPARLLVLSDALEEAGCTEAAILDHLRFPGPHVRGCWALDLILGKQ